MYDEYKDQDRELQELSLLREILQEGCTCSREGSEFQRISIYYSEKSSKLRGVSILRSDVPRGSDRDKRERWRKQELIKKGW